MVSQSFEEFQKGLERLVPLMERLSLRQDYRGQIIWLNQPPTIDLIATTLPFHRPPEVYTEKIERYNSAVRKSLEYNFMEF